MLTREHDSANGVAPLLNLDRVNESERVAAWHSGARTYFPGLSVRDLSVAPAVGTISGSGFGAGQLWTILSPPLQVHYDPAAATPERVQLFSLMLQLRGSTLARQSNRTALLRPGEMCVIDGRVPFELSVGGVLSHFIVVQMPRLSVLSRYAYLERRTAVTFDPEEAGSALLRSLVMNVLELSASMESGQRSAALNAIIQLMGTPRMDPSVLTGGSPGWRVQAALTYIDSYLSDPELTACRIAEAQGVSRRRLDEIMVSTTGASVTAHIWSRRLEQAASDLLDERFASGTITQVAFAVGFEDVAHFTRAFKRRFRSPPSEWRTEHRARQAAEQPEALKRRRN